MSPTGPRDRRALSYVAVDPDVTERLVKGGSTRSLFGIADTETLPRDGRFLGALQCVASRRQGGCGPMRSARGHSSGVIFPIAPVSVSCFSTGRPRLHRPAAIRTQSRRRCRRLCVADAPRRHRSGRRALSGSASGTLRGNQRALGEFRLPKRPNGTPTTCRPSSRAAPGGVAIAGRHSVGSRSASREARTRSTFSSPAAGGTSRNSTSGDGRPWNACRNSSSRSNARSMRT